MARRRHSGRRRRGSLSFLYKLLSMLVICGAIVAALTLFFRVNTVVVSGQQRYTQQQILDASGIQTGDNLFLLNKYDVANQIIGELPYIETIRINRKLPDTLLVEVQECSAVLAVVQENNAWLVSPTGKIVDRKAAAAADQYPIIDGCTLLSPSVGSSLALGTEYARKQEQLEVQLQDETARQEELQNYQSYTQSQEYVEDIAKSKLGLAYDNEIIFKEEP